MTPSKKDYESYKGHYSENGFKEKIKKVGKKAGAKVVYAALLLFYTLKNPDISTKDKAKIWGALGYFILPLDLIPDWIPVAGFQDDLAALLWGLYTVSKNITPQTKALAQARVRSWFGDDDAGESEL